MYETNSSVNVSGLDQIRCLGQRIDNTQMKYLVYLDSALR